MDDDKYVDAAIRPVLPSRAATADDPQMPAFLNNPSLGTDKTPRGTASRKRGSRVKTPGVTGTQRRSEALPPREVERILKARKKNMKKRKTKNRTVGKHPALAAPYRGGQKQVKDPYKALAKKVVRPKNPNRPLELKNVMLINGLTKPGRQRVLDALAKVYA